MRSSKQYFYAVVAGCAMLIIILDGKTALQGATIGINLCIRTIIPSLFPFFILSGILNSAFMGQDIPFLRPLGKLCKIPKGSESVLLLGFLAGYPVGAQLIGRAYKDGKLSLETAKRMVSFCNNAGPAFIFGMISSMFTRKMSAWVLWAIHILSGLLVGCILPSWRFEACRLERSATLSISKTMENTIRTMATVCGWVIVFRIVLGFCDRWFMWRFPIEMQVLFSGLLELSNGCVRLAEVQNEGLRFTLASILLSSGGLCVTMQTVSVSQNAFSPAYFLGKGMQTVFSALLSLLVQHLLFDNSEYYEVPISVLLLFCAAAILTILFLRRKKDVAISGKLIYNTVGE